MRGGCAFGLGSVALAGVVGSVLSFSVNSAPAEDAAMLMRYAQHLGSGNGITWNIGEAPVDGATDVLPLLVAGSVTALGISAVTAVRMVALFAHVITAMLVLWVAQCRWRGWWLALIVLCGPGWFFANAGYITPMFGLLAAVVVTTARAQVLSMPFVLAAVLLATARPEGAFLAGTVLVAAVWIGRRTVQPWSLVLGAVCLAGYLVWRRWYFGDWIPSPYYVKGGMRLHLYGVTSSLNYVSRFLWFALPLAIVAWRRGPEARRAVLATGVPVVAFAALWILLSGETNYGGRFQYAVLPMAAVSLGLIGDAWWPVSRVGRVLCTALLAVAAVGNAVQYAPVPLADGRREVGQALEPFAVRAPGAGAPSRRTIAVTEAGLVPLYSGWRTIDTLGLNDPDIARRRIDTARLEREQPDVLLVHRTLRLRPPPTADQLEDRMTHAVVTLFDYAHAHGFVLVRDWGETDGATHAYFVRSDAPDSAKLIAAIRGVSEYACLTVSTGEAGLREIVRSFVNAVRGVVDRGPACVDWSGFT